MNHILVLSVYVGPERFEIFVCFLTVVNTTTDAETMQDQIRELLQCAAITGELRPGSTNLHLKNNAHLNYCHFVFYNI